MRRQRKCWWDATELMVDEGTPQAKEIKVWARRVWTLELSLVSTILLYRRNSTDVDAIEDRFDFPLFLVQLTFLGLDVVVVSRERRRGRGRLLVFHRTHNYLFCLVVISPYDIFHRPASRRESEKACEKVGHGKCNFFFCGQV